RSCGKLSNWGIVTGAEDASEQHVLPDERRSLLGAVRRGSPQHGRARTDAEDVHPLGDAPLANGLARGTARERIDQPISPCRPERAHQTPRGPWKLAKHAFQEVRHRVEGD